jgi:glycosyltransferase 2 family protein
MKKIITQVILPIIVLLLILIVFFNDITFGDIKLNFLKIPLSYLVLFMILTVVATVLRTYKYYILLAKKLSLMDLFLITLVRNFSVDLLPGRAAAMLFYSWLTKRKGIAVEEGASSFVISVFYDALALAFMLSGLLFFLRTNFDPLPIYLAMGIIFIISIVMIFFADVFTGLALRKKMFQGVPKLENVVSHIDEYLRQHKSNGERLKLFLLSFVVRLLKYIYVYILFEGVVQIGVGMHQFSLFSFGLAGTELSSLFPIQGPGGFGTWELAFTVIFEALKVPAANIKEAGFVIHITSQVWEYTIGFAALAWLFFFRQGHTGTDLSEKK